MKKLIIYSAMLLTALASMSSCREVVQIEVVDVEVGVPVKPLTSYSYDGQTFSCHRLQYGEDSDYLYFLAGREPEDMTLTSYVEICIPKYNLDREIDFADLSFYNRIDYIIQFEDAMHFYSPIYGPLKGKLKISRLAGQDKWKIDMDACWIDGKHIKFNYSGQITRR